MSRLLEITVYLVKFQHKFSRTVCRQLKYNFFLTELAITTASAIREVRVSALRARSGQEVVHFIAGLVWLSDTVVRLLLLQSV